MKAAMGPELRSSGGGLVGDEKAGRVLGRDVLGN